MNRFIRRERFQNGNEINPMPFVQLTFLMWGGPLEPTVPDRWEHMATFVREAYQDLLALQRHMDRATFEIEMLPNDERVRNPLTRMFRNVDAVTGDFLNAFYEQILQSDETIELTGLRIIVKLLGTEMQNRRVTGRGRAPGFKSVPPHLKNKGLCAHPQSLEYESVFSATGLCGPRALLFTRYSEKYCKQHISRLHDDSKVLATKIGLVDGLMKNSDIEKVVALPEWECVRIIIFSVAGTQMMAAQGEKWEWPDQPRTVSDPLTICIMFDPVEKHYWAVSGIKTLAFVNRGGKHIAGAKMQQCYRCYTCNYDQEKFDSHNCLIRGLHHCEVCKEAFSLPGLERHRTLQLDDTRCECCVKTKFYGQTCFDKHIETNCHAPKNINKVKCPDCHRTYQEGSEHVHNFPKCRHCAIGFSTKQEYNDHQCYLTRKEEYWADADEEDVKWKSQWFYDFETCRGEVTGTAQYKHDVMAWCLQLIVPDQATRDMLVENEVLDAITLLVEDQVKEKYPEVGYELIEDPMGDTIRIYGKILDSFIFTINKLKSKTWAPTFWAHNGSKFDAKFVLDYYLNHLYYDLGGEVYEENEDQSFKKVRHAKRKNVCSIAAVGSKVLQLKVDGLLFRCSHAHFAMELRKVPAVFGLQDLIVKGEFPYGYLSHTAWGSVHERGLPPLKEYDPNARVLARRTELIDWWVKEQQRRNVPKEEIQAQLIDLNHTDSFLAALGDYEHDPDREVEPWVFNTELWKYLYADVNVGARCMEQYHQTSLLMHEPIWEMQPGKRGCFVSPLGYCTAPGWANAMYRSWFVPENTCAILRPNQARFIRDSLHGGRTDKRANYVKLTPEQYAYGDRILYVDFKSLYPSVQKTDVHDTYYPVGQAQWIPERPSGFDIDSGEPYKGGVSNEIMLRMMANKTGFLKVGTKCLKYVTHPTLSRLASNPTDPDDKTLKLLFENRNQFGEIYAWPELEEAILSGEIEVTHLLEGLLFEKGTVFNDYVNFFFKMKQDAEDKGNAGLRELAKLLLNSLWGKMGQRSYGVKEWVHDEARLDFLIKQINEGVFELLKLENREPHRVWIEYRKKEDFNNLTHTNYQLAAFVSMWGRVILHRKVLNVHGQRVLYSDTDSGIVYVRKEDSMPWLGNDIGDLTDEIPKMVKGKGFLEPYIEEAVFVAPKTYGLKIRCAQNRSLVYHKVVCKGFEASFAGSFNLNFESMKELVIDKYEIEKRKNADGTDAEPRKRICGVPRLQFRSSMANNTIVPQELMIQKNMEGGYTKGQVHPTDKRLIIPFGDKTTTESFLRFEDRNQHYE